MNWISKDNNLKPSKVKDLNNLNKLESLLDTSKDSKIEGTFDTDCKQNEMINFLQNITKFKTLEKDELMITIVSINLNCTYFRLVLTATKICSMKYFHLLKDSIAIQYGSSKFYVRKFVYLKPNPI